MKKGENITLEIIEENIGISKDFNIYELQNALGDKDILKSNKIIKFFSENPKNHPFVFVLSSLFSYFQKLMTYNNLTDKTKGNVSQSLGINPFFDSYRSAKNYPPKKLFYIFKYFKEYDLKSKELIISQRNKMNYLENLYIRYYIKL